MKKISYLLISLLALGLVSCKKEPTDDPTGKALKLNEVIAAASDFYSAWEGDRNIPSSFSAGGQTLTSAQFICAEAQALVQIAGGKSDDIALVSYKAASNPDRDSYTSNEIQVGASKAAKKETLVEIAEAFLKNAAEKKAVPNQTNVYDGGSELVAFSTNRLTVTVARAIAGYAENGALPVSVNTEYLPASTSLKAFAEQFVHYLEIYENTIADKLSADGSHCTSNNNAWERVHFVPIPYDTPNDYKNEGKDQYDFAKYGNPWTFEIEGVTYTAAQSWEIAIRGLFDLCTAEGASFPLGMGSERNKAYTLANGKSLLAAPISRASENCIWGAYPWYEKTDDGGVVKLNGEPVTEVDINFLLKCGGWHICRAFYTADPLGKIGNFQIFGAGNLELDGYEGLIAPMREFLIAARFYKYILDNNITSNVYDAIKDVKVSYELYDQSLPLTVSPESLSFEATSNEAKIIKVTATDAWNATPVEGWINVTPASGAAGETEVSVTVAPNSEGSSRSGSIAFTAGDYVKSVPVSQAANVVVSDATIKDFVTEYVKILDIWKTTVGKINQMKGEAAGGDAQFDIENAHYVPESTTITVGGKTYTTADMFETALRSYLFLRGWDGNWTGGKGAAAYTDEHKVSGCTMSGTKVPATHAYTWGSAPYNETSGNGGALTMGAQGTHVNLVKLDILDNFAFRSTNFPVYPAPETIPNMCGYTGNQVPGYYGAFCSKRALITYAMFFKYMLDNQLETAVDIPATTTFTTDLYGETLPSTPTIKDFAKEYVKLLTVWQNTTGDVQIHETVDPYTGVHNIPLDTKITVAGTDLNISQCLETAMRSYMLLCGKDGNSESVKGANKFPAVDAASLSADMPGNHNYGYSYWYMETPGNGGPIRYNNEPNKLTPEILLNYSERNINYGLKSLGGSGNWSNVSGYNSNANFPNHPEFTGCLVSGRVQMAFLNVFKYMLDNGKETFSATDLPVIDCTLWGDGIHD